MQLADLKQTIAALHESLEALELTLCAKDVHDSGKVASAINQVNQMLLVIAPLTHIA